MSKTKNKPGIHLYKVRRLRPATATEKKKVKTVLVMADHWYWHIVAKNGRIIARISETYTRKSGAVKSIKIVAQLFYFQAHNSRFLGYYDHSKPDSPLQSYL